MSKAALQPDEVISALNNLIEISRDGQNGFKESAEHIESPQIKEFFLQQSLMRAQFVGDLQQQVRSLGGDPENTGSMAAALHRGWIDIKSAFGGGDHAILAASETGEDSALKAYDKALKEQLPAPVRMLVENQRQSVKQTHDKVKSLRDKLNT